MTRDPQSCPRAAGSGDDRLVSPAMRRLIICLGVLVLGVAACSDQADTPTPTTPVTTTTTAPPETTTAAPAETTTTPVPTTTTTVATTTTTPEPTTSEPAETTTTLPPFPSPRESLEHGGEAWVVILAGADDFGDPALDDAVTAAADAGYVTGPTDCDFGAAQALGMSDDAHVVSVSVYFETEADAQAALVAFAARGVSGTVATVNTYCLD
jgi:hypothetical protein